MADNEKPEVDEARFVRSGRYIPALIFLSLLCFYSLILSTRFDGYERGFFGTAVTFVTRGEFHMGGMGLANTVVLNGRRYVFYVLQSILDIPLVAAGREADSILANWGLEPQFTFFFPKALNAILTALTAMLVYLFSMKIYRRELLSLALAYIFGLTTMAMPYATIGMDPLITLLVILGFYLVRRCSEGGGPLLYFITGAVFGLGMGAKSYAFITYPFAGAYLFMLMKGRPADGIGKKLAIIAIGGILGIVPYLWYNYIRYGDILASQMNASTASTIFAGSGMFGTFIKGLYASFFSAGKSFFLYSPPLILLFWGLRKLVARSSADGYVFTALSIAVLVFFCTMNDPMNWADEVWGDRYYLVLVPFLVLSLGGVLETFNTWGKVKKFGLYVLLAFGFLVQLPGSLVYYGHYVNILESSKLYSIQNSFYIPELTHLPINVFLIAASLANRFTGSFPAYYYLPRTNMYYRGGMQPIMLNIDPAKDYIGVWWWQILNIPELSGTSRALVMLLITGLVMGFLAFGYLAYRLASRRMPT